MPHRSTQVPSSIQAPESPIILSLIPWTARAPPSPSMHVRPLSPHHHKGKNVLRAFREFVPFTPSAVVQTSAQDVTALPTDVTRPSSMLSPPDFNRVMDSSDNPLTPQVSGYTSVPERLQSISIDSLKRDVPARGHGHAPHGIPDFMVLRQDTYDILLVVEDKLHDNPMHQLSRYSALFPDSLDIWFMGCRVAAEPEGGLEFMLAERDRQGSTVHNLQAYYGRWRRRKEMVPVEQRTHPQQTTGDR